VVAVSRGLGRAVATVLTREGARVITSSRDEETLSSTAVEIAEETSGEVSYFPADLTAGEQIKALVSHMMDRLGGVDILVTNTG
jgi:3-oxoacyl-[acyl-carrier protein] reductase